MLHIFVHSACECSCTKHAEVCSGKNAPRDVCDYGTGSEVGGSQVLLESESVTIVSSEDTECSGFRLFSPDFPGLTSARAMSVSVASTEPYSPLQALGAH